MRPTWGIFQGGGQTWPHLNERAPPRIGLLEDPHMREQGMMPVSTRTSCVCVHEWFDVLPLQHEYPHIPPYGPHISPIFPHILPVFPHIFSLFPHMGAGFCDPPYFPQI